MSENIFADVIRIYGETSQENLAAEECAELILAISHKHRGRAHNIPEEIADVEIMLEQLKIINDCHNEVAKIREIKLARLKERIESKNE